MANQKCPDDDPAENPADEILKIGARLTAALSAEEKLARLLSGDPENAAMLERWRKARLSADSLGRRYAILLAGPKRGPEPREVMLRALAGQHAEALRAYALAEQTALESTAKLHGTFRELRIVRLTLRWLQKRIAQLIANNKSR
jgi:hypothetical protein